MDLKRMFQIWSEMKKRCDDESHYLYAKYGGQGISYQSSWQDFEAFYKDMYTDYPKSVVLKRFNSSTHFSETNCYWFDIFEPNIKIEKNKQDLVAPDKALPKYYFYRGEVNDLTGFSKKYDMNYDTLRSRILRGWTIELALTKPIQSTGGEKQNS